MKNNKLIKSLAAMTLAASLFAGAASLVSAADNDSNPGYKTETHDGFNPDFFKNLGNGDGESNDPSLRPADPKPANPNAIDVPTPETPKPNETKQPEVTVPDAEKAPSSTDKKEEKKTDAPAVKKVLPKTSAVK